MSRFWQNWLIGWCLAVGMFGALLAGGVLEVTSGPVRMIFAQLNGPGQLDLNPHVRFCLAVLGAVSIGWSITLYSAISAANQLGKQAGKLVWRQLIAATITWYVIDSGLSIATGFGLNAIPNTVLLAGFLLPVISSGVLSE